MYELCFDGSFQGIEYTPNAGWMCIGWVIQNRQAIIAQGYGVTARGVDASSIIAEYLALIDGLQALLDMDARRTPVRVVGDAKAVIHQMSCLSKVSSQPIIPLHRKATRLANKLHIIDWQWVPRRQNRTADQLTRRAMREFLTDRRLEEDARMTILEDNKARRNSLRVFAGMLVFTGQTG